MDLKSKYNRLDLLTVPISLSYKEKYLYRTFIGATLTIICFIIIVIYFIIKLNEIISKSSFTIISNEFQSPKESINFTNVPILFTITDLIGNPLEINPRIFGFSVILNEYVQNFDSNGNSNMTHTETQLETERCDKLNDSIDLSFFAEYNISDFKCIKPLQNITINGTYGAINGYRSLKIILKKCNNLIQSCYNDDYLEYIISNTRFTIAYLGYKTNFYNSNKKDIENIIYTKSIQLSPFLSKSVFYYMTLVKYQIYDNLFMNKKREKKYYLNRDMLIEYIPINKTNLNENSNNYNSDNILGFFSFIYDGNVLEYTKRVKKMSEIISYIGNLFNIVLTIFRIINNYFSSKILFVDIYHQFFFEKQYLKKNKTFLDNSSLSILPKQKLAPLKSNSLKINTLRMSEKSLGRSGNSILNLNNYIEELNKRHCRSKISAPKFGILNIKKKKSEEVKFDFFKYFKLYYFCPVCIIRNKKNSNFLFSIKNSICKTFSLENFIEFIKVSKTLGSFQGENLKNSPYEFNISFKQTKI